MNYYNEIDPHAAQWIRNLIAAGVLPAGDVDERSIEDVTPNDIRAYSQCHFFAGLGGWAYALDLAGWPRDRPVWTGSCPCQPFSAAGKGAGFADERHLWPAWQHLIAQCRPAIVFGEQVASKAADDWIDLVHADLEGMGYAFGCVPFPAAGVGAPHIRDRNYWVGHADHAGLEGFGRGYQAASGRVVAPGSVAASGEPMRLADAHQQRRTGQRLLLRAEAGGRDSSEVLETPGRFGIGRLADAERERVWARGQGCAAGATGALQGEGGERERLWPDAGAGDDGMGTRPGPVNGLWRTADWLACRDGKWRPVEPGSFPLAHGVSGRVGRLRAYGNAIVPQAAAEFVTAYLEARAGLALEAGALQAGSRAQGEGGR